MRIKVFRIVQDITGPYLNVPGVGDTEPGQLPGHAELHPGGAGVRSPVDWGLHTSDSLQLRALPLGLQL